MKCLAFQVQKLYERSSPSRGTWIEMTLEIRSLPHDLVVPLAGDVD